MSRRVSLETLRCVRRALEEWNRMTSSRVSAWNYNIIYKYVQYCTCISIQSVEEYLPRKQEIAGLNPTRAYCFVFH